MKRFCAFLLILLSLFSNFTFVNAIEDAQIVSFDNFSIEVPFDWVILEHNDMMKFVSAQKSHSTKNINIKGGNVFFSEMKADNTYSISDNGVYFLYDIFYANCDNKFYKNLKMQSCYFLGIPVAFASFDLANTKIHYEGILIFKEGALVQLFYTDESNNIDAIRAKLFSFLRTLKYDDKTIFQNIPNDTTFPRPFIIDLANADEKQLSESIEIIINELELRETEKGSNLSLFDVSAFDDQRIDELILTLQQEKINREKMKISLNSKNQSKQKEGEIVFRGVPWYSTRKEAESIIGVSSKTKGPNTIYRLEAIDYDNVTMGSERVDDLGGCRAYYSNISIGGLKPSSTYVCYIYPIIDGKIIRDDDLSQLYFGYYKFSYGDFGDYKAIYNDLKRKLNSAYGNGEESIDTYHTITIWKDDIGNTIQLLCDNDNDYASLGYIAADANDRLDEMIVAINQEKAQEETKQREINENNMEGL